MTLFIYKRCRITVSDTRVHTFPRLELSLAATRKQVLRASFRLTGVKTTLWNSESLLT